MSDLQSKMSENESKSSTVDHNISVRNIKVGPCNNLCKEKSFLCPCYSMFYGTTCYDFRKESCLFKMRHLISFLHVDFGHLGCDAFISNAPTLSSYLTLILKMEVIHFSKMLVLFFINQTFHVFQIDIYEYVDMHAYMRLKFNFRF